MSDPFGISSGKKAAALQAERTELERTSINLRAAKERRETVRTARIAAADARQAAASQGVSNSSAATGGQGSITSQFNSNISFLDNQHLISDQSSIKLGEQREWERKARKSKAIWGFGLNLAVQGAKAVIGG